MGISFIQQFNQDTTNNCILKKILKDCFIFTSQKIQNMNYYFRSQNNSNTGGMIAIRKPKKSVKWADYNLEKPLQQIRLIDIVGKGKKLPNRNTNNSIITNNLQNNKPKVIVNHCQVRTCPYFGQYHQPNSMRQLEDQTATVMQLLSKGNVVDAILQNLTGALNEKPVETIQEKHQLLSDEPKKRWESKKFLCDDCGFTCASKTTLNTHKMFKHGDLLPKSLNCDQCDYTCDHPTQLTSHRRIIHEEQLEPLECAHCPLQVRTQAELDKHLRNIHSEEKPFVSKITLEKNYIYLKNLIRL